ncbi:MAG: 3-oxoacyl-[acyl-carrier protein] reductase [Acidobacteriota bacterium]|nr:3-oxoacyl-[acyl-carrier protein] reductase [Acidobacteriota bacterium]
MQLEFEGKVALLTGAASGIGRACAVELARGGADIALVDVAAETQLAQAENLLKGTGGRVLSFRADVAEHARAAQVVEETAARLGRLDILVNAAGVTSDAPLWEMTEEQWRRVLDVNLKGAFSYTQAAARHFRQRRAGKVVNVASIEAMRGRFGLANYAASKAGLVALTRSTATELGRYGVNVNAVAPGFIRTPLIERLPEKVREQALRDSVLGRMGEPEDVAHAVVFLCSERARYITGAVLTVDGGQLL